jgi:hypothetical protein
MYECTYIIDKNEIIIMQMAEIVTKMGDFIRSHFFLKKFAKPFLSFILASDSKSVYKPICN